MAIELGGVRIDGRVFLAPMAGYTDEPFRKTARMCGAAYTVSEMLTSQTRLWKLDKSRSRIAFGSFDIPRAAQLLGNDPEQIASAALSLARHGAQVIDFNMGCPAKKVCAKDAGAALMKDEALCGRIFERLGKLRLQTGVSLTLKTRLGWDEERKNVLTLAEMAQENGFCMVAVHARTAFGGFSAPPDWRAVAPVREALEIPVVINGGIGSPEDLLKALEDSKCDAAMIGRAALGAPWVFSDMAAALGEAPGLMSGKGKKEIFRVHLMEQFSFYPPMQAMVLFKKHLTLYARRLAGLSAVLGEALRLSDPGRFKDMLLNAAG